MVEGQEITLVWTYTLDGTVRFANFVNVTGGGSDSIARIFSGTGSLYIESKHQGRFEAQVSNTQAQLTNLRVQRSDQGMYRLNVSPTGRGTLMGDVELIVHCKYS